MCLMMSQTWEDPRGWGERCWERLKCGVGQEGGRRQMEGRAMTLQHRGSPEKLFHDSCCFEQYCRISAPLLSSLALSYHWTPTCDHRCLEIMKISHLAAWFSCCSWRCQKIRQFWAVFSNGVNYYLWSICVSVSQSDKEMDHYLGLLAKTSPVGSFQ